MIADMKNTQVLIYVFMYVFVCVNQFNWLLFHKRVYSA